MDDKELRKLAEHYDTHDVVEELGEEGWTRVEGTPRDKMMITTSLRLPKPIMDEVRRVADDQGVKPTALMRQWIEAALSSEDIAVPMSVLRAAATEYQHRLASLDATPPRGPADT